MRAKNENETATHMHGQLATLGPRSARPPGRPDEQPDERATYLCSLQPRQTALAEPPPAASPQLGRWICQQRLRSARVRGLLLVLAAASAAAAASTTTALAFLYLVTSRAGMTVLFLPLLRFSRHGIRVTLLYVLVRVARGTAW